MIFRLHLEKAVQTELANSKNQLIVLEKCITNKIIPKSFQVKSPILSKKGKRLQEEYQMKLLKLARNEAKQRMYKSRSNIVTYLNILKEQYVPRVLYTDTKKNARNNSLSYFVPHNLQKHFPIFLRIPLHTPHLSIHTPHFTTSTSLPPLHTSHMTHHTSHFTLQTLHSTLHAPHFTLHIPYSTLHTPHFTLSTLHFTFHTSHSTLSTSPFTLHTSQSTSHFTIPTFQSQLHAPHFTHHTSHCTLHTSHCTLHTSHFTLHTSHSSSYFTLYSSVSVSVDQM